VSNSIPNGIYVYTEERGFEVSPVSNSIPNGMYVYTEERGFEVSPVSNSIPNGMYVYTEERGFEVSPVSNSIPNGMYVYTEERGFEVPHVLYLSNGSTGAQRCWSVSRNSQRLTCFTHAVEVGSHIASLFYLRLKQTEEPRRVPRPLNLHITARELCTERDTIF